jgi:hypothetical protein
MFHNADGSPLPVHFHDGQPVRVLEQDGETIMFARWGTDYEELGDSSTVLLPEEMPLAVLFRALARLNGWQNGRRTEPRVHLQAGGRWFCQFSNRLCMRFRKKRGYVNHYAPTTVPEAVDLSEGRLVLRYIKGSSRFRLVKPDTPKLGSKPVAAPKPKSDMHVGETINWWMED